MAARNLKANVERTARKAAGSRPVRAERTGRAIPAPIPPGRSAEVRQAKVVTISYPGDRSEQGSVTIDPLRVKIAVVAEALGSKSNAAEYLGVSRSQPGKWLSGAERPHPRARRQIQDFDYVWDRLTDERSPEIARLWLSSPNSFLNGTAPLTWLKARGAEDVVAAIDAEEAGSFA